MLLEISIIVIEEVGRPKWAIFGLPTLPYMSNCILINGQISHFD